MCPSRLPLRASWTSLFCAWVSSINNLEHLQQCSGVRCSSISRITSGLQNLALLKPVEQPRRVPHKPSRCRCARLNLVLQALLALDLDGANLVLDRPMESLNPSNRLVGSNCRLLQEHPVFPSCLHMPSQSRDRLLWIGPKPEIQNPHAVQALHDPSHDPGIRSFPLDSGRSSS